MGATDSLQRGAQKQPPDRFTQQALGPAGWRVNPKASFDHYTGQQSFCYKTTKEFVFGTFYNFRNALKMFPSPILSDTIFRL